MRKRFLILLTVMQLVFAAGWAGAAIVDPYGFRIDRVSPSTVGNTGSVTLHLIGLFPGDTCRVRFFHLYYAQEERLGTVLERNVGAYTGDFGELLDELVVRFDLTGVPALEDYSIEVIPEVEGLECGEGPVAYAYSSLDVEPGRKADLWVEIIGRANVRAGTASPCEVWYGNHGNVNMDAALLFVAIPAGVDGFTLGFDRQEYALPVNPGLPPPLNTPPSEYTNVIFAGSPYTVIPLFVRNIAPGEAKALRIDVQWSSTPTNIVFRAWWSGSSTSDSQPIWQ